MRTPEATTRPEGGDGGAHAPGDALAAAAVTPAHDDADLEMGRVAAGAPPAHDAAAGYAAAADALRPRRASPPPATAAAIDAVAREGPASADTTIELDLESSAADDELAVCYICMDDDDATNGLGAPLRQVCACTSSAIHALCLEKVLNSRKSRAKPLDERTLCTVCHGRYTLPLEPYVLGSALLPPRLEFALRTRGGQLAARLCVLAVFGLLVTVFALLLFKTRTLFAVCYLVVATLPALVVQRCREVRRQRVARLDDCAFHAHAVAHARREVALGRGPTAAQTSAAPPQLVVLLVPAAATTAAAAVAALPLEPAASPHASWYGAGGVGSKVRSGLSAVAATRASRRHDARAAAAAAAAPAAATA
jgi:hypothetical protein